ncbi:hypothetical protein M9H77_01809 [Catharanthus roseus]|uniref:Uncharacterized protein n=1 Tax=Catharanthus roseus TaxID=4058 RepID=A0ACC0C6T4_CATRO|nr:hypothetical protein M9H77_01809 [Catharanthus roseus]
MKNAFLPLHIWTDEDVQILDFKERDEEDLADRDVLMLVAPSHPNGIDVDYVQPFLSVGGTSYAPPPPGAVGLSFDAPPPPGTAGSSVPHMPKSRAFSSNSDEHGDEPTNDVTPAQQLGFGHRIGKRTTRFTPSNWR